jgi:hypothetical protein
MSYRYVAGFYATDPVLSDLGEAAVRFVLLAEREYDSTLSVNRIPADSFVPTSVGKIRNFYPLYRFLGRPQPAQTKEWLVRLTQFLDD